MTRNGKIFMCVTGWASTGWASTGREGVYFQGIFSVYHRSTPRRQQFRRLFPVCITVQCVHGSYTDRQTAIYTAIYSRQSSYTGKEKSSQLMTTGDAFASIVCII